MADAVEIIIRGKDAATAALRSVEGGLDRLGASASKAQKHLDGLAVRASSALRSLGGLAVAGVTALGAASIKASLDMEQLMMGLRAVEGSSEGAQRAFERLKQTAKLPGLGLPEAIQGFTQLRAAGMDANLAVRSLEAFGNALATVGKGRNELALVTLALSQMAAKGKIMGQDLRQVQEQVPQMLQILKRAFGTGDPEKIADILGGGFDKAVEKVNKAQEKLAEARSFKQWLEARRDLAKSMQELFRTPPPVPFEQALSLIVAELEKLPKAAETTKNSWENVNDSLFQTFAKIGDVFKPGIIAALDKFNDALTKMQEDGTLDKLINTMTEFISKLGEIPNLLQDLKKNWDETMDDLANSPGVKFFEKIPHILARIRAAITRDESAAQKAMEAIKDIDARTSAASRKVPPLFLAANLPKDQRERLKREFIEGRKAGTIPSMTLNEWIVQKLGLDKQNKAAEKMEKAADTFNKAVQEWRNSLPSLARRRGMRWENRFRRFLRAGMPDEEGLNAILSGLGPLPNMMRPDPRDLIPRFIPHAIDATGKPVNVTTIDVRRHKETITIEVDTMGPIERVIDGALQR